MATKKKTRKQQKIEAEKQALRQRLCDMLAGAAHGCYLQDDGKGDILVTATVGLDELAGWLRAIHMNIPFVRLQERWPGDGPDSEIKERAFKYRNLRHFDTLNNATDHLYDYGFRAEE